MGPSGPPQAARGAGLFRLVTGCPWDVAGHLGKGSETTCHPWSLRDRWPSSYNCPKPESCICEQQYVANEGFPLTGCGHAITHPWGRSSGRWPSTGASLTWEMEELLGV